METKKKEPKRKEKMDNIFGIDSEKFMDQFNKTLGVDDFWEGKEPSQPKEEEQPKTEIVEEKKEGPAKEEPKKEE